MAPRSVGTAPRRSTTSLRPTSPDSSLPPDNSDVPCSESRTVPPTRQVGHPQHDGRMRVMECLALSRSVNLRAHASGSIRAPAMWIDEWVLLATAPTPCLLYTSDAADEEDSVDL